MFTKGRLNEQGLIKPQDTKNEFVLSVPMMTRLAQDGAYLSQVQKAHLKLKQIRPALKV